MLFRSSLSLSLFLSTSLYLSLYLSLSIFLFLSLSLPLYLQSLAVLEAMPSSKQYSDLEDCVGKAVLFIRYPGHCLRDGATLLSLLANLLYPELRYLSIIR